MLLILFDSRKYESCFIIYIDKNRYWPLCFPISITEIVANYITQINLYGWEKLSWDSEKVIVNFE
jgi:hypothetical protein